MPGFTAAEKYEVIRSPSGDHERPKLCPGSSKRARLIRTNKHQPDHPFSPETRRGKEICLFKDLPSIDYGEGGCHREKSGNRINCGHEPRLESKGGVSVFFF